MSPEKTEALERATVAAVSPPAVEEIPGWILPFDDGTVGRAKSAVPLFHSQPDLAALDEIESRYAARGLACWLRLPQHPAFAEMHAVLLLRGYRMQQPTQVQVAATRDMRAVTTQQPAAVAEVPDDAWAAVFLGEGFDPVDGASRVAALGRATGSVFASVRENGVALAAGAGAFGFGWASVHGMRTAQAVRGQGLGGRVLAGLADAALARGCAETFLQVDGENAAAVALYRRAGFKVEWTYAYWRNG